MNLFNYIPWTICAIFCAVTISFVTTQKSKQYKLQYLPQSDVIIPPSDPNYQQILEETNKLHKQTFLNTSTTYLQMAVEYLNITYTWQQTWPKKKNKLGEVSAVAFDVDRNVVLFHRGDRVWNQETFGNDNFYKQNDLDPIAMNTIVAYDREEGNLIYEFGNNTFFMPHGLTIDQNNNFWITDVALHQIMKFSTKSTHADLVLGQRFIPGTSTDKFCKPTAVAVLPNGDFFVADGYCNSRIMKFSPNGQYILSWGRNSFQGTPYDITPPNFFAIPHALTLALDKDLLCVADRENGRIQCFHITNGTFHSQYHSPIIGDRLFGVSYTPIRGGQLFVINGPTFYSSELRNNVFGFVIDMKTKNVLSKFGPNNRVFNNSHDIIVSPDGTETYVADLSGDQIYKFKSIDSELYPKINWDAKPTVTLASSSSLIHINGGESGITELLIVSIIVIISILIFGLALLIARRGKRGNSSNPDLEYSKLMSKN